MCYTGKKPGMLPLPPRRKSDYDRREEIIMKSFASKCIQNIALLGHGGSGKTTLAEAILYRTGQNDRIGKTDDGTSLFDFDPEEKKRKISVGEKIWPLILGEKKINLIDVPGQFDFAGSVTESLCAADGAVIVISGKSGLTVGARKAIDEVRRQQKAMAFFIGKLNSTHAHFYRVISALTGLLGGAVCPVVVPLIESETVIGYADLIHGTTFSYQNGNRKETALPLTPDAEKMKELLVEAVASTDETLMEKYFDGKPFTDAEMIAALQKGIVAGDLCPVFCGIQATGEAVETFVGLLADLMPTADRCVTPDEQAEPIAADASAPASFFVFKTVADPFVGKLSYFKVLTGVVRSDSRLMNLRTGEEVRLSKLMVPKAGKQEDVGELYAGDIGCLSKLSDVKTGDTIGEAGTRAAAVPTFPKPTLAKAIVPKKKGEEEKLASGIARLCEEDPTLRFYIDPLTKESILVALGEQQFELTVSRLKSKFGVEVELKKPKIAYRETIRKTAKVQGKYKKQSGGHGQFGDVWIEFSPAEEDTDLIFEERVVGGAVPKNYFPAVEKGLRESVLRGVLAGYPMVGIRATLYDGSYHPVDSSEMSFKTAASLAFKEGIPQCRPVLLEPFGKLKAVVPDDCLGDVISDINKRRGRIIGMNPVAGKQNEVIADVPMAEMSDFSTAMRSLTGGTASFELETDHYEEVPEALAEKIIAQENAG